MSGTAHITGPASVDVPPRFDITINNIVITDSLAINNPNAMTLTISCSVGLLSMNDANGNLIIGAGTNLIMFSATLPIINAALATLIYSAVPGRTDIIHLSVINQDGISYTLDINIVINLALSTTPVVPPTPPIVIDNSIIGDSRGIKANRIADMLELFGINIISATDIATGIDYSAVSVITAIQWLVGNSGFNIFIRDRHHVNEETGKAGFITTVNSATHSKFALYIGSNGNQVDISSMLRVVNTNPTAFIYLEGINSPNVDVGQGLVTAADTITMQQTLWQAAHDLFDISIVLPAIAFNLPFIDQSISQYISADSIKNFANRANIHLFPPYNPDIDDGSNRGSIFADANEGLNNLFGGMPQLITAWHPTLHNQQSHILDDDYAAYYAPMFILSAFNNGFAGYFWHNLFDTDQACGLFPNGNASLPRQAAYAIRAMFNLLPDASNNRRNFITGQLDFTINGLVNPINRVSVNTGGQSALFQASDGTFGLYIWNSQNTPGGGLTPVTLKFNSHSMQRVREFKINGSPNNMTPLQDFTNVTSITTQLDASVHLFIINY